MSDKWQEYWNRCITHAAPEVMIERIVAEELAKANDELAILKIADNASGYNKIIAYKDNEIKRLREINSGIKRILTDMIHKQKAQGNTGKADILSIALFKYEQSIGGEG